MEKKTMASKEFTEIPNDPKGREAFNRQFMTQKDLAVRWKVSESAINYRKANSDKIRRFELGGLSDFFDKKSSNSRTIRIFCPSNNIGSKFHIQKLAA
jgi:hypothetical protein